MLIADEIKVLLAKADALRVLPEDAQEDLPAVVDRINALRVLQADGRAELDDTILVIEEAAFVNLDSQVNALRSVVEEVNKRKPGRPRKSE